MAEPWVSTLHACLFVCLMTVCLSVNQSVHFLISQYINLFDACLLVCLSIGQHVCLSVCLPVCLSACLTCLSLSVCWSVYLSVWCLTVCQSYAQCCLLLPLATCSPLFLSEPCCYGNIEGFFLSADLTSGEGLKVCRLLMMGTWGCPSPGPRDQAPATTSSFMVLVKFIVRFSDILCPINPYFKCAWRKYMCWNSCSGFFLWWQTLKRKYVFYWGWEDVSCKDV